MDFRDKGEKLLLGAHQGDVFLNQLRKDVAFFVENNIIDYSLLIGIHYLDRKNDCTVDCNFNVLNRSY